MPGVQEPKMGFWQGYNEEESGIKTAMDFNWRMVGALAQITATNRNLTVAPSSPIDGQTHIVAASGATGVWVGMEKKIAIWRGSPISAWEFYTPKAGWLAIITSEGTYGTLTIFNGSVWSPGMTMT